MKSQVSFSKEKKVVRSVLNQVGFKAIMCWHYIVLFTPMLLGAPNESPGELYFYRQLVLYISLGITFSAIAAVNRRHRSHGSRFRSKPYLVVAGVLGSIASLATSFFDLQGTVLYFACAGVLGATQASIMYMWIHWYMAGDRKSLYERFSIDMLFGAMLTILVAYLVEPVCSIVIALLPLIASAALFANWTTFKSTPITEQDQTKAAHRSTPHERIKNLGGIAPIIINAFAFGLLQGVFLNYNVVLLMAVSPAVLLGIPTAGLIIYVVAAKTKISTSAYSPLFHRVSLFLLIFGTTLLMGFASEERNSSAEVYILSEIVFLMGFNLFDVGIMARDASNDSEDGRSRLMVDNGRLFVYFSLAVGLVIGFLLLHSVFGTSEFMVDLLCEVATMLILATLLLPSAVSSAIDDLAGKVIKVVQTKSNNSGGGDFSGIPSPFKQAILHVSQQYCLSPRETEILTLLAKGRNADYIEKELVISINTAKTHIANIYGKLNVHSSQELITLVESFKNNAS